MGHQPHQSMSMVLRRCCSSTLLRVSLSFFIVCVSVFMFLIIIIPGLGADSCCLFAPAALKDVVGEVVIHTSLVCLIITSLNERSLHPSLTEVQGSHLIQGFAHIQPPDQVSKSIHTYICAQTSEDKKDETNMCLVCCCL